MNTITMESLLITEDEWIATEGVGSAIKKGASGAWEAIKSLGRKILDKIITLISKIVNAIRSLKRNPKQSGHHSTPNSAPKSQAPTSSPSSLPAPNNNDRQKNAKREEFVKSSSQRSSGGVKPTPNRLENKTSTARLVAPGTRVKEIAGISDFYEQLMYQAKVICREARDSSFQKKDYDGNRYIDGIKKALDKMSSTYLPLREMISNGRVKEWGYEYGTDFQIRTLTEEVAVLQKLKQSLEQILALDPDPEVQQVCRDYIREFVKLFTYYNWTIQQAMPYTSDKIA